MMGRLKSDQGQLFYEFHLGDVVPEDHLVRKIDAALDLSWLRSELAPHYSSMGRPSIDPELMIRMLVVGYVFAIRSERLICREVQVNLAYRWFCKLGIEHAIPDHSVFSRDRNERFREGRRSCEIDCGVDLGFPRVQIYRNLLMHKGPDHLPPLMFVRTGRGHNHICLYFGGHSSLPSNCDSESSSS